jgi:rhodanese-related sulfurtransferase
MSFDTIRTNDIEKYIGRADVVIIDLREQSEYNEGHIPGAINIPYDELDSYADNLPHALLIFYCERGNISLMAARDLAKYNYHMKSLYGGLNAYHGKLEKSI